MVTDLRDKPQVASFTWMAAIAADRVSGFGQARVEQLAWARPFETAKSQAQAHEVENGQGLASIQTASIEAGWHRPSGG